MNKTPVSAPLRWLEHVLFGLLSTMVVIVFANVVARFIFASALTWADEMARFLFIWLTFLGATLGVARGAHIGMDIVVAKLGSRMRRLFEIVSHALVIVFLSVWGFFGWSLVSQNLDYLAPATEVPMGYIYAVAPMSALFMGALYVGKLVQALRNNPHA